MPHINRVRVNNIKYNNGTQFYDDFCMNFQGKNALYDLANGGGKSVLLLLLLQNLIPNCTLDDKQPVEKLFRGGNASSVIHSLIEWRLDRPDSKRTGYKYMTTGFCARKGRERAADRHEGEEAGAVSGQASAQSIEYFNYCIFYSEYGEHDIRNLPLTDGRERITYSGLRSLLKQLSDKNSNRYMVMVFDRKNEYQRFIAGYGLYESQWNIIRGINKTEGHVRTYFETAYRTTRKVVEDLLIEEIIQKAYQVKIGQENEDERLAATLLDIRDKMMELSRKKRQIAGYDRQIALLEKFSEKLSAFLEIYREQEVLAEETGSFYFSLAREIETLKKALEELSAQEEDLQSHRVQMHRRAETLKLMEAEHKLELCVENLERTARQCGLALQEKEELERSLTEKETANYYLEYASDREACARIREEIEIQKKGSEEQYRRLEELVSQKKVLNERRQKMLDSRVEESGQRLKEAERRHAASDEKEREADRDLAVLRSRQEENKEKTEKLLAALEELKGRAPVLVMEQLKAQISQETQVLEELLRHRQSMASESEEMRKKAVELALEDKNLEHLLEDSKKRKEELESKCDAHRLLKEQADMRGRAYGEEQPERLLELISHRREELVRQKSDSERELSRLRQVCRQLEAGVLFAVTDETSELLDYLERKYQDGTSGADMLSRMPQEARRNLLERFSFLPYCIVVSHGVYDKIKADPKPDCWKKLTWTVPVIDRTLLDDPNAAAQDGILFAGRDISWFIEKDTLEKELHRVRTAIGSLESRIPSLSEQEKTCAGDCALVSEYLESARGYGLWVRELEELKARGADLGKALDAQAAEKERTARRLEELEEEQSALAGQLGEQEELLSVLKRMDACWDEFGVQKKAAEGFERRQAELTALQESCRRDILLQQAVMEECRADIRQAKEELRLLAEQWSKEYAPYDRPGLPVPEVIEEDLDVKLSATLKAFEQENSQTAEKNGILTVLEGKMSGSLNEMKKRKADLGALELLYEERRLKRTAEEALSEQRDAIERAGRELKKRTEQKNCLEQEKSGHESEIRLMASQIAETYGSVQRISEEILDFGIAIAEAQQLKKAMDAELSHLREKLSGKQQRSISLERLKDSVNLLIETYAVNVKEPEEGGGLSYIADYAEALAGLKDRWNRWTAAKERAGKVFEKAKQECEEGLKLADALPFALQLHEQVHVPKDSYQTENQIRSLEEACSMTRLEKERIESGLRDIEKIRESFENQCLQRCNNVKMELDKFPKLSSIIIDGELTQIVKLHVPYVKEEQQGYFISEYLEKVMTNMDRYDSEEDKKRYVIQELSLKRLFSVIVRDMNGIGLELYKRERIKEQSRHLRYEDAVGSTGQSQGIYIQFLIAVINYIASINSWHGDPEDLTKVIFIDNPFGAAKDTYIWEPIFAMLLANQVQLIVPTRGATPAITGKFDVNYVLGQKVVGGRQQTVVVDYRSQIEADAAEYIAAEYKQETLPL